LLYPFKINPKLSHRKDSLTFGNKPERYNQIDLYDRVVGSINGRLIKAIACTGLHLAKRGA
jgi:hypothetical protein